MEDTHISIQKDIVFCELRGKSGFGFLKIVMRGKGKGVTDMEERRNRSVFEDAYEQAEKKLVRIIAEVDAMAYGLEAIYQSGQSEDSMPADCLWQISDELKGFREKYFRCSE